MKLLKTIPLFLTLSAICFCMHAQNKGSVTGVVKDAITRSPIGYATIVLIDKNTNSTARQTQTDAGGGFVISNLPHGIFKLQISLVGYETLVTDSINITTASDTFDLGVVNMYPCNSNMFSAVTVEPKKGALQNTSSEQTDGQHTWP